MRGRRGEMVAVGRRVLAKSQALAARVGVIEEVERVLHSQWMVRLP
jgi:hypothetical protein